MGVEQAEEEETLDSAGAEAGSDRRGKSKGSSPNVCSECWKQWWNNLLTRKMGKDLNLGLEW